MAIESQEHLIFGDSHEPLPLPSGGSPASLDGPDEARWVTDPGGQRTTGGQGRSSEWLGSLENLIGEGDSSDFSWRFFS